MSFTGTTISEVVKSDAFLEYVNQLTMSRSALVKSGVVKENPAIQEVVNASGFGGQAVNMPSWGGLGTTEENLTEDEISVKAVVASKEVAPIIRRVSAWGGTDLAKALAGSDPMKAVAEGFADFRAEMRQEAVVASLKGIFAGNAKYNSSDLILDITGLDGDSAYLQESSILYAAQLLGDAKKKLTAIGVNSATETRLNVVGSKSTAFRPADVPGELATYNSRYVIMDDAFEYDPETGIATVYLFAEGAINLNSAPQEHSIEPFRAPLKSYQGIISRDAYIAHVVGTAWQGNQSGVYPTNSELADEDAWRRVFERKAMKVCALRAKVATPAIELNGDTEVTPDAPTAEGNVITIPVKTGVEYQDDSDNSPLTGTVTLDDSDLQTIKINAVAKAGYKFAQGATVSWTFAYDDGKDEVTPEAPTVLANVVTIPTKTGVIYKDDATGNAVTGTVTLDDTTKTFLVVTAEADDGYKFPVGATAMWAFYYVL